MKTAHWLHLNQFSSSVLCSSIQNYNQTIELDPKYAGAFNNRGIVYRKLGKEKEAIEDFKTAQALDPSIIANEKIKALEKEFAERIAQTQESNTKVQGFQDFRSNLMAWL
jgi:tetratricopeptide (TPR) repeat protein